ncbi:hypothetical protein [Amycolatopsis japonica]
MDIVYVLKPSESNDELRHSLRSVAENLPHAKVWIVGYKPSWITNVEYLPVVQQPRQKHPNSLRNQRAALTHHGISDPFAFWNDDFFLLQPLTEIPVLNWGWMDDVIDGYGPTRLGTSYYQSMLATREILHDLGVAKPISYAAHVPLVTHKAPMLAAMHYNRPSCWVQHATIYGNLHCLGGETLADDVKVYDTRGRLPTWVETARFVSTTDMSFMRGQIGRWLRDRFPNPCHFEADA